MRSGQLFGHPAGLTILFCTEMWTAFSFYGMRALLVYYMVKHLAIPPQSASMIYGIYAASVFLTPIFGGAICDRWLGRRRSVIAGGTIMALGHFVMASETLLYPALALIAIGNGLFLPSLPSQIPGLYADGDPRAKGAYAIYYAGINLGGFLAPLVCGTLGEIYGWHWGFGTAGVGMVVGLLVYLLGGAYLPPDTIVRTARDPSAPRMSGSRIRLLAGIAIAVIVFRIAYEQQGNTIALWTDSGVDRGVGGLQIPMTWFQSLNALLVFALTPVLVAAWRRREQAGHTASSVGRMSVGAALVAVSYLMLSLVALMHGGGERTSWVWLVLFLGILTLGELYILPVGLGLFARLAPAGTAATMIAAWFLAGFAGNLLAGTAATFWSQLGAYGFFLSMAAVAAVSSLLLLLLERRGREVEHWG